MTTQTLQITVPEAYPRLDHYLVQRFPNLSRAQWQKLIKQGAVLVNDDPTKANRLLEPNDILTFTLPEAHYRAIQTNTQAPTTTLPTPTAEDLSLNVIYHDDALIVVNKSAGLVVHPGPGHLGGTLVNGLLHQFPDLNALSQQLPQAYERPGIVHRLDQDTSGVIVVARTLAALDNLQAQFKERTVEKDYLALVYGQPPSDEGMIDVPLGRHPVHRQKFAARPDGKEARTHYRVRRRFDHYSLLEIGLETGRTHQIRVHLAWLQCSVVGDTVYGRRKVPLGLKRQFLHAWQLRFKHPTSGEQVAFTAPLTDDLQDVIERLSFGNAKQ